MINARLSLFIGACACSEKAELGTEKTSQARTTNATILIHTRNPARAHSPHRGELRALAPTKPNLEREKEQALLRTR